MQVWSDIMCVGGLKKRGGSRERTVTDARETLKVIVTQSLLSVPLRRGDDARCITSHVRTFLGVTCSFITTSQRERMMWRLQPHHPHQLLRPFFAGMDLRDADTLEDVSGDLPNNVVKRDLGTELFLFLFEVFYEYRCELHRFC